MGDTVPVPEDWSDREAVAALLRTLPPEVRCVLAMRSVLRALPLLIEDLAPFPSEIFAQRILPIFRGISVSWLASASEFQDIVRIRDAAKASIKFSQQFRHYGTDYRNGRIVNASDRVLNWATDLTSIINRRKDAINTPSIIIGSINSQLLKGAVSSFQYDLERIRSGVDAGEIALGQLWHGEIPRAYEELWTITKIKLINQNQGWEVWAYWYEARLNGGPVNLDLETSRVFEPRLWDHGPKAVNAEIGAIIAAHEARRAPVARRLVIRPETGLINAAPVDPRRAADLAPPEALERRLRASLPRAFARLREAGANQPYSVLFPALDGIDTALAQEPFEPETVHDEIDNTLVELQKRLADGDVPDDALMARLSASLRKAAADIEDTYPSVGRMVAARSQAALRRLKAREVDLLEKAFDAFEAIVEPQLKELLGADAEAVRQGSVIAAGDEPVPDGRLKARIYRLRAYVLRIVELAATPPKKLLEILDMGVKNVKRVEDYKNAWDKLEPFVAQLVDMLSKLG